MIFENLKSSFPPKFSLIFETKTQTGDRRRKVKIESLTKIYLKKHANTIVFYSSTFANMLKHLTNVTPRTI